MKNYKIIKIIDNNNKNFYLDITTMADARTRLSILKREFHKFCLGSKSFKPVFELLKGDYSHSVVFRGLETMEDAKAKKEELYNFYKFKYKQI